MPRTIIALLIASLLTACASAPPPPLSDDALLDDVQRRTFAYFWDLADPQTHLIPDRAPSPSAR